jgi:RNA polymerase sigma factor (TIGR02999 family)
VHRATHRANGRQRSHAGGEFKAGQLDQLFNVAYEELRRLASAVKRSDGSVTLNPTALVNEAWLKLAASAPFAASSKLHFQRIAARAMRQVLVEAARRRNARKRGGDQGQSLVTFHDSIAPVSCEAQMLSLDHALDDWPAPVHGKRRPSTRRLRSGRQGAG